MSTFVSNDIITPDENAPETSHSLEQVDPNIPENGNPISDFDNHQSLNPNGEIRHRTGVLASEDGLGSTELDSEPNEVGLGSTETDTQSKEDDFTGEVEETDEDKVKKLIGVKVILFDWAVSILGTLVPFLAIIFGLFYRGRCPAFAYLPYIVLLMGILSLHTVRYALKKTSRANFICLRQMDRKNIEFFSKYIHFLFALEALPFIFLDVSFDSSAHNYCAPRFYYFTIFMNVLFALGFCVAYCLMYCDPDNLQSRARSPEPYDFFDRD